jgi:hypothetical protein
LVFKLIKSKRFIYFRDYTTINLDLLPPYKGKGQFKVVAEPGKELIVMFKMKPGQMAGSFSLPIPRMSLLY